jgi:hypothetical protein
MDPNTELILASQEHAATLAQYKKLHAKLIEVLRITEAVLVALGERSTIQIVSTPPPPMIDTIVSFLHTRGAPAYQSEIVSTLGKQRHRDYPELLRPYGDVWKSLQHHHRHNGPVCCVEHANDKLKRADIQERKKPPRAIGGRIDDARFYCDPDNLFWLRDEMKAWSRKGST